MKNKEQEMNIYQKLQRARAMLQAMELKKSGKNKHLGFVYFELSDFMPAVNNIFDELGLFSYFNTDLEEAVLTIFNAEKPSETIVFSSPVAEAGLRGGTPIQNLGAVHTYMRRYLYYNALEIVEHDAVDSVAPEVKEPGPATKKPKPKKTKEPEAKEPETQEAKASPDVIDSIRGLIDDLGDEDLEANIVKGYNHKKLEDLTEKQAHTVRMTLARRLEAKEITHE